MNKALLFLLLLFLGCLADDSNSNKMPTNYSKTCKPIPDNWILLSKGNKIEWLKEKKFICKPSVPFLLDVVKIYSNRDSGNRDIDKLIYRNIVRLHVNREYFILMSNELNQIKKDCKNKESELDLYFILRTLFKDAASVRDIERLIFDL